MIRKIEKKRYRIKPGTEDQQQCEQSFLSETGLVEHFKDWFPKAFEERQEYKKEKYLTELVNASYQGQLDIVKDLIEKGVDINGQEPTQKKNALNSAACCGQLEVINYLLEKGANLDVRGEYGRTPLMCAIDWSCSDRRYQAILSLIKASPDINATDDKGRTALYYAIRFNGHLRVVEALINAAANINQVDRYSDSPTHYAINHLVENLLPILQMLIKAKADVKTMNEQGVTPLKFAMMRQAKQMVVYELIQAGADKNELFLDGQTELMYGVLWNDELFVETFLQNDTLVNAQDKLGRTALMLAAQKNNIAIATLLLKAGAQINTLDEKGCSALFYCGDSENMVRFLISAGADINVISKDGYTILHEAVLRDDLDVIKLLLKQGIDKKVLDSKNMSHFRYPETSLSYASSQLTEPFRVDREVPREIVFLLLKSGADPHIETGYSTAFERLACFFSKDSELNNLLMNKKEEHNPISPGQFSLLHDKFANRVNESIDGISISEQEKIKQTERNMTFFSHKKQPEQTESDYKFLHEFN